MSVENTQRYNYILMYRSSPVIPAGKELVMHSSIISFVIGSSGSAGVGLDFVWFNNDLSGELSQILDHFFWKKKTNAIILMSCYIERASTLLKLEDHEWSCIFQKYSNTHAGNDKLHWDIQKILVLDLKIR